MSRWLLHLSYITNAHPTLETKTCLYTETTERQVLAQGADWLDAVPDRLVPRGGASGEFRGRGQRRPKRERALLAFLLQNRTSNCHVAAPCAALFLKSRSSIRLVNSGCGRSRRCRLEQRIHTPTYYFRFIQYSAEEHIRTISQRTSRRLGRGYS